MRAPRPATRRTPMSREPLRFSLNPRRYITIERGKSERGALAVPVMT